jgi:hypothetical protein
MKFFGRKPSSPSSSSSTASPALACAPDAANKPSFPSPVLSQQMTFSLNQCSNAQLIVSTRGVKAGDAREARYDVVVRAHQAPLEAEWSLGPEQAREIAAHLLEAAAECEKVRPSTYSGRWD